MAGTFGVKFTFGCPARLKSAGPLAFLFSLLASISVAAAPAEPHASTVVRQLAALKSAILAGSPAPKNPLFVTFWDFDGTILAGDCSEGWVSNNIPIYKGLAEQSILAGLSQTYQGAEGWRQFWEDYQRMDQRPGHWLAYPYIPQMLRGASRKNIDALAQRAFENEFRHYFFAASMEILRGISALGIEAHVVSASAECFVRGAASATGIPPQRMHGIRVAERDGQLTEELVYPVTWADGKVRCIEGILEEFWKSDPKREVFVLGAFGNSYSTDGPFLSWTAKRQLPGGLKPVVLMINGGAAPPRFQGQFSEVSQTNLVGSVPAER
jgi:phosphoserine phosphatase